jgi:nitroimidazol reductase NimA-like FMN-containing flavoprotein (pyridoxamine 5'-phosphate oxidase superfamily)
MSRERYGLEVLTTDECMALLDSRRSLGRIGYVVDGVPIIVPVNYVLDDDSIVFLTTRGSKLSWLSNHRNVAFEVDEVHSVDESGWSVLVRGTAAEVTDPAEVRRLRRGPLRSWAVPTSEHWVRLTIGLISGRRLGLKRRSVEIGGSPTS